MSTIKYPENDIYIREGSVAAAELTWADAESHREAAGPIDHVTANAYGLEAGKWAESKTWTFNPDPWVIKTGAGQALVTLTGIRFTIVRATLTTGGYRCYMVLRWDATSNGWRTWYNDNPGMPMMIDIKNASDGVILPWDLSRIHFKCDYQSWPMTFQRDFDPDIYPIIAQAHLRLLCQGKDYFAPLSVSSSSFRSWMYLIKISASRS